MAGSGSGAAWRAVFLLAGLLLLVCATPARSQPVITTEVDEEGLKSVRQLLLNINRRATGLLATGIPQASIGLTARQLRTVGNQAASLAKQLAGLLPTVNAQRQEEQKKLNAQSGKKPYPLKGVVLMSSKAAAKAANDQSIAVGRFLTAAATVQFLQRNPSVMPDNLTESIHPWPRYTACAEAQNSSLTDSAIQDVCTREHPYISAQYQAGLESEAVLTEQMPRAFNQLTRSGAMQSSGRRLSSNEGAIRDAKQRFEAVHELTQNQQKMQKIGELVSAVDDLKASKTGQDFERHARRLESDFGVNISASGCSFPDFKKQLINAFKGCITPVECKFPVPEQPELVLKFKFELCASNVYEFIGNEIYACNNEGNGCVKAGNMDNKDTVKFIANLIGNAGALSITGSVCVDTESDALDRVFSILGLDMCFVNMKITWWQYRLMLGWQCELVSFIGFAGIQARIQVGSASANPFCSKVEKENPFMWNTFLKCQDVCSWEAGQGDIALYAGVKLPFVKKTWKLPLLASQSNVKCDKPPPPCQPGEYRPPNLNACIGCPEGRYSAIVDAESCLNAPLGTFVPKPNSTLATPCQPTTYQELEAQNNCITCPEGAYTDSAGQDQCKICEPGSFCSAGASKPCGPGTYQPLDGMPFCKICDPGTGFMPGDKSTGRVAKCNVCPLGYSSEQSPGFCKPCAPGSYAPKTGLATCMICAPGTGFMPEDTSTGRYTPCNKCPEGFSSEEELGFCTKCQLGTIAPSGGQPVCNVCPTNTTALQRGLTLCTQCQAGYWAKDPAKPCGICEPPSKLQLDNGKGQCCQSTKYDKICDAAPNYPLPVEYCTPGFYWAPQKSKCEACPAGTLAPGWGPKLPPGNRPSLSCQDCPYTSVSPPGSATCTNCDFLNGEYRNVSAPAKCARCPEVRQSNINIPVSLEFNVKGLLAACCHRPLGKTVKECVPTPDFPLCMPGQFYMNKTQRCEPCPVASFTNATNWASECTKCSYNEYTPWTGFAKCTPCRSGEWRSASRPLECVGCPKGTLKFKNGAPKCCTSVSCSDAPDFPVDTVNRVKTG